MQWIAWSLIVTAGLFGVPYYSQRIEKYWIIPRSVGVALILTLVFAAGFFALVYRDADTGSAVPATLIIAACVMLAITMGGPVTEFVFRLAKAQAQAQPTVDAEDTEESNLRGGLWIGLFERSAIVVTLFAGWPEGMALAMAVKGLGRFSELQQHAAAEQFILGTFSSVLSACAAYGLGVLLLH